MEKKKFYVEVKTISSSIVEVYAENEEQAVEKVADIHDSTDIPTDDYIRNGYQIYTFVNNLKPHVVLDADYMEKRYNELQELE